MNNALADTKPRPSLWDSNPLIRSLAFNPAHVRNGTGGMKGGAR